MQVATYFNREDFEKTNFSYSKHNSLNISLVKHKQRNYGRLKYNLPNGVRSDLSRIPIDVENNPRARKKFIQEFERLLVNGFFPIKDIPKLMATRMPSKGKNLSLDDAIDQYYTKFNAGKNEKKKKVIRNEKGTMTYCMRLFKEVLNKHHIYDVTSKDLGEFNIGLKPWCASNNKPIASSTEKSYKKIIKAFWNCMNLHFDLDLNTQKIDLVIYASGKPNPLGYTRQIHIPPVLLDHVDLLDVKTTPTGVNRKELSHLLRKTGLCREELSTLSEHNLYPSKENFDCIKIFNKEDCPTLNEIGFTVKTERRKRTIPLDARSIQFIKSQLERHRNDKIFGKVTLKDEITNKEIGVKILEYRFLFPMRRNKKWIRCDNYLHGLKNLFKQANQKFQLGFNLDYQLHDYRRTLNGEMGDAGMSAEERAVILGHSKEVNEFHYMNYKKLQAQLTKQASNSFKSFLNQSTTTSSGNPTTLSGNP